MASDVTIEKKEGTTIQPERVRGGNTYMPAVDILEDSDKWLVLADMPGTKADDIDIRYEQGQLAIHARVKPRQGEDKTRYLLREYGVGDYYRCFQIGEGIDAARIQAEVTNGVLKLHLPKSESVRPRKIVVQSA